MLEFHSSSKLHNLIAHWLLCRVHEDFSKQVWSFVNTSFFKNVFPILTLEKITEFVFVQFIDSSLRSLTLVLVLLYKCAWNAVITTECQQNVYAFYNTGTLNFTLSLSFSCHKSSYHMLLIFFNLFIFRGHSTREPASGRLIYFILQAYIWTMC